MTKKRGLRKKTSFSKEIKTLYNILCKLLTSNVDNFVISTLRIVVAILLLCVSFFILTRILDFFSLTPHKNYIQELAQQQPSTTTSADQSRVSHDISVDTILGLLSILSIFGGILAYVFNTIIKKDIEKKHKLMITESRHFTEAQMLKVNGFSEYTRFLIYRDAATETILPQEIIKIIDVAIIQTQKALDIANRLDGLPKRNELLMCVIKNNIAWLYAEKLKYLNDTISKKSEETQENHDLLIELKFLRDNCQKEKDYVYQMTDYTIKRAKHHPEHAYTWKDTGDFVAETFL